MEAPTGCSGAAINKVSRCWDAGEGRVRGSEEALGQTEGPQSEQQGFEGRRREEGGERKAAGQPRSWRLRGGEEGAGQEGRDGGGAVGGCSPAPGSRLFLLPHCPGFRFPPGRGVRERGRA